MVKNHLTHGICQRKFGRVKGALLAEDSNRMTKGRTKENSKEKYYSFVFEILMVIFMFSGLSEVLVSAVKNQAL